MHKKDFDFQIKKLSKIEGHASLDIKIRKGQVEDVDLRIMENKRFFTEAVQGKPYFNVPQLVSRICGTCSIAHLTCCIEAIEKALKVKPSAQTMLLRKLTMYSLMIRDHALHLYFFVLPDLLAKDSLLDLSDDQKYLLEQALEIKEAGNYLARVIAGRAVHAPFEQIGGFSHLPNPREIKKAIARLEKARPIVIDLVKTFGDCQWKLDRRINFVGLVAPDFSFLEGEIKSASGAVIKEEDYWDHLHNVVLPYSQATGFEFEGQEYLVGALARLNLNKQSLHPKTQKDVASYLGLFPSFNIYHNNLGQAIEILHSIDHSIELLEKARFKSEKPIKPSSSNGEGVGVIEAPRGTLYYWLSIKEGKIGYLNLIIPTAQNLIAMRQTVRELVRKIIRQENPQEWEGAIRKEVEKIIRAYDPCMSCASHFLKVNWI